MKKGICFMFSIITCFGALAKEQKQEILQDSISHDVSYDLDLSKIELPPVSVFLEAANNFADVKYFDSRVEEQNITLKQVKKDWLSYVRLQGNYQYGTNNALMTQSGEQFSSYTTNTQSWYNVGVGLSIPLNDIFSRKQKTGIIKSRIDQAEFEAEKALEDRKLIILQAYNEVVKSLALLKVNAEAMALYDAQMKVSENDFVNGRIDIISLSLERARRAEAMVKYQESRAGLYNSVTMLEMLTKVKITKQ